MKLTVLVDNNTLIGKNYFGEPGLSIFIEEGNNRILFDMGYSDIFLRNACSMGIDLKTINYVILSHGHLDHTWGMSHLLGVLDYFRAKERKKAVTLLAHPMAVKPKTEEGEQIGIIYSEEVLRQCFNVHLTESPVWLSDKLVYLGRIDRLNDFENKEPIGVTIENGAEADDYILDDSALAYRTENGIVIITGCSHSGICNIVECAKRVCGDDRVVDIIGGFHLLDPSEGRMKGTLEYMERLQPGMVHACHCTDLSSKIALSGVVNLQEVGVGKELTYE